MPTSTYNKIVKPLKGLLSLNLPLLKMVYKTLLFVRILCIFYNNRNVISIGKFKY